MDDYTLSMAEAINEHQGNADADHFVNVSMAEAINEYQDRFSADTEGVTEHQATIPADTNHSPGAKIVFASADEPWLDEMAHPFSSADAIATPSHRAADANICPTLSHVPQVGQVGQMGQVGQPKADWRRLLISADVARAEKAQTSEQVGMLTLKSANKAMADASHKPDPKQLWLTLWSEGEVCCLFADSNLGKSIYAVQIATEIASSRKVLLFDFELTDKQFQLRYTDELGRPYDFPDNLYRVEINPDAISVDNFEDSIMANIEHCALRTGAKVLIIDNLTYLCNASEKGDAAGALMMRLMQLKRQYGLSILVLAHTPKRQSSEPITQNDLAGSKKLFNFFDSVFAIGRSAADHALRYIKQIKVRNGDFTYGADNVMLCSIEKLGAMLQFSPIGTARERDHLSEPSASAIEAACNRAKQLYAEGYNVRQIAAEMGKSKSAIARYLKQ